MTEPDAGSALVEANQQLVLSLMRKQAEEEANAQAVALRLENLRLGEENRQLAEASRLKSQFLANLSHELRTPLNAVIGFAQLLSSGTVTSASPKYLPYLDHIHTSGQHLLTLIDALLDLSKATAGKLEFHPEPLDLRQTVDEVGTMLALAASAKGVTVSIQIEPGLDGLVLDKLRFKQALANYLSNAIKFSHERGRVTVRCRSESAAHLRVEVQDHGIGIDVQDLPHLFVAFHQVDGSRTRRNQGTGLGLALTRMLVEAQGGRVGLISVAGGGSTFHFVLKKVGAAG